MDLDSGGEGWGGFLFFAFSFIEKKMEITNFNLDHVLKCTYALCFGKIDTIVDQLTTSHKRPNSYVA